MKKGAGVLAIKDGKVLLVKAGPKSQQLPGQLSFPGGRVEDHETEEQAASREFTEETGLITKKLIDFPGNYIEALLPLKKGHVEYSFKVFLVREFSGELKASAETTPFWENLQKARSLPLLGKDNQILESAIKFLNL